MRGHQSRDLLDLRAPGLALAALLLAPAAAPAQRVGPHAVPPDPAAASARQAAAAAAPHLAELYGVAPLADLRPAAVEEPGRLAALHAWNAAHREPLQNGFARLLPSPRRVSLAVDEAAQPALSARGGGVLAQTGALTVAWGGRVRVAGADRLRLHLSGVTLPAGARLWVHGGGQTVGPFGKELMAPDRSLWTPSVAGEELALDVEAPTAALARTAGAGFTIDRVLELVAAGDLAGPDAAPKSGCQLDASCFSSADFPGYDVARHAIAHLEFVEDFNAFLCTGQLLNDTASDGIPYLLTAHHCISTQTVASSLQASFDDFTPSCNGTPPVLSKLPTANGSTLLVSGRGDTDPDFTLLRLASLPSGRSFLGWDATAGATPDGTLLYRISHPSGDFQMYSVTRVDSRPSECSDNFPPPRFIYSDLVTGAASPGSSGSAALLADGTVVGQLFIGCGPGDFCSPLERDGDGAFAVSFDQLQPFLAPGATGSCVPGDFKLCLVQDRFQVQVTWANQFNGTAGVARAIVGTDETGYFFFTDPSIYELAVKILDFGPVFKVFYGELTDLHFTITVADTLTGRIKTYTNTPGDCGGIDEAAFPAAAPRQPAPAAAPGQTAGTAGSPGLSGVAAAPGVVAVVAALHPPATPETSAAGLYTPAAAADRRTKSCGGALCLLDGRFSVDVSWFNQFSGASGAGAGGLLSDSSGLFTFTDPSDVELIVKVVPFLTRVAFYYAALSDFEYDITVSDNDTGVVRTYHNPAGSFCGGIDNTAFPP